MALLAEELVEEWLNRQGYFTIRGIKIGVQEVDLLALRPIADGLECRHVEVQASVRPVSYLTRVPKEVQKTTGIAATSAKKRSEEELRVGVREWVDKKFRLDSKVKLRERVAPGQLWSFELVVGKVKHPEEIELIASEGVMVHRLSDVVHSFEQPGELLQSAAGADFADLVLLRQGDMPSGA